MAKRPRDQSAKTPQRAVAAQQRAQSQVDAELHMSFSGPVPPPDMLRSYNEIVPGAAERIMNLFEEQVRHRHAMERFTAENDARQSFLGLVLGFIIAVAGLVLSLIFALTGREISAIVTFVTDVVALTSIFVYGSRNRRIESIQQTRLLIGEDPSNESQRR